MKKIEYSLVSKYRNVIMGLSIISILIFHYVDDCRIMHYNYHGLIKYYNILISSSGVDIFLILSGVGLYYSFKKNNKLKDFFKKRFVRILIPYFILAIPAWIWYNFILHSNGIIDFFKDLLFITLFERGDSWFWYIFMIIICYLIFPYFFSLFDEKQSNHSEEMRMLIIFVFFLVINMWLANYNNHIFGIINKLSLRFTPFIFGVYLGKRSYNKEKMDIYPYVVFVLMSLISVFLLKTKRVMVTRMVLTFLAISYYSVFLLIIDKLKNSKFIKIIIDILSKIGEYTLELYITHVCIRRILNAYGYYTCRIRYYLIVIILSIILSFIIKKSSLLVERKIIKK